MAADFESPSTWVLAREYGFTDIDGTRPDWGAYATKTYGEFRICDEEDPPAPTRPTSPQPGPDFLCHLFRVSRIACRPPVAATAAVLLGVDDAGFECGSSSYSNLAKSVLLFPNFKSGRPLLLADGGFYGDSAAVRAVDFPHRHRFRSSAPGIHVEMLTSVFKIRS